MEPGPRGVARVAAPASLILAPCPGSSREAPKPGGSPAAPLLLRAAPCSEPRPPPEGASPCKRKSRRARAGLKEAPSRARLLLEVADSGLPDRGGRGCCHRHLHPAWVRSGTGRSLSNSPSAALAWGSSGSPGPESAPRLSMIPGSTRMRKHATIEQQPQRRARAALCRSWRTGPRPTARRGSRRAAPGGAFLGAGRLRSPGGLRRPRVGPVGGWAAACPLTGASPSRGGHASARARAD